MTKKYLAKRDVSLTARLKNGKGLHVSFCSLTGGGSVYYTSDADVQDALERHPYYGKLFTLAGEEEEAAKPQAAEATKTEAEGEQLKTRLVSCIDDAKDILADEYGIGRSKLKTKALVEAAAKQAGIKFEMQD